MCNLRILKILGDVRHWVGSLEESSSLLVRPHQRSPRRALYTSRVVRLPTYNPKPHTPHPTSFTPKPTTYTLHPNTHTPHPTSYTLHPKTHTLYRKRQTLKPAILRETSQNFLTPGTGICHVRSAYSGCIRMWCRVPGTKNTSNHQATVRRTLVLMSLARLAYFKELSVSSN